MKKAPGITRRLFFFAQILPGVRGWNPRPGAGQAVFLPLTPAQSRLLVK